jgi:hypothetical protein
MKKHLYSRYPSRHISMNLFLPTLPLRCNGARAMTWTRSRGCNTSSKLKLLPLYSLTGERRTRFKHRDHKRRPSNGIQDLQVECSTSSPCDPIRHRKEWHSNRPNLEHKADNRRKHASISHNGRRHWRHSSATLQRHRFLAANSTINMHLRFQVRRCIITKNRLISIKFRLT